MAEQKKNNGCLKVGILVGVLFLLGASAIVLVPALWFKSVKREQVEEAQMARLDGTVVFQRGEIPDFPAHRSGEEVEREQFVALMIDDLATELTRKEFQKTANGAPVAWLLETEDISDREGGVYGQFSLPYRIVSGNSSRGSVISLTCEFARESKEALLGVRRGDWVMVEGTLSFDGRNAVIKSARVVDEPRVVH